MKLTFKQKETIKIALFYIFVAVVLLLGLKEAAWQRRLDIEYKQAIIEMNEREER